MSNHDDEGMRFAEFVDADGTVRRIPTVRAQDVGMMAPPRQHVSDAAWERCCTETANYYSHANQDYLAGLDETEIAERGLMIVTVEEWDAAASGHHDAQWIAIATQADDIMQTLRRHCHTAIERMKDAEGKLLDANIRIEWLERQLKKCSLGWLMATSIGGFIIKPDKEAQAKRRALLTLADNNDPRFGR